MVTNINLAAPDAGRKPSLTGKSTLVVAISLLAIVAAIYGGILYLKDNYSNQNKEIKSEIEREKSKMAGTDYMDLFDFQERLTLLSGVIDDHSSFDIFLKDFSRYFIPEVYLVNLSFDNEKGTLELDGSASSLEALSREMMLLKSYPGTESLEFKSSTEKAASEESPGGVDFKLSLQINKSVLKK